MVAVKQDKAPSEPPVPELPTAIAALWAVAAQVSTAMRTGKKLPNLDFYTKQQCILIAAKVANVGQSDGPNYDKTRFISMPDVAAVLGLDRQDVNMGKMFLRRATAEEINLAINGQLSVHRRIRNPVPRAPKVEKTTGEGREAYYNRIQIESQIWNGLKEALHILSTMPAPDDVIRIARGRHNTRALVDSQVLAAFAWFGEFAEKWTAPEHQANGYDKNSELRKDK